MKFFTPYKCAAFLLLVFCAGHTFGGMLSQTSMGSASDQVFAAMKSVHFDFAGADSTWYGFWFGFGLMLSVFLVFSAFALWQLDRVPVENFAFSAPIAWALAVTHVAIALLSYLYFFAGPATFATVAAGLIAFGTLRKSRLAGAGSRPTPHSNDRQ